MLVLVLAAAGLAGTFVLLALDRNLTYLHSPTEVHEGKVPADARFKLGGVVLEGSVRRTGGDSLQVDFVVTDRRHEFPVRYVGILPDMFREGTSVIATGRIEGGVFVADEVLAKHDENYMPREVQAAIDAARENGAATPPASPAPAQ
jgi:cytochrome c-type biogenesis protein CcmE